MRKVGIPCKLIKLFNPVVADSWRGIHKYKWKLGKYSHTKREAQFTGQDQYQENEYHLVNTN